MVSDVASDTSVGTSYAANLDSILRAERRLLGHAHRTQVIAALVELSFSLYHLCQSCKEVVYI